MLTTIVAVAALVVIAVLVLLVAHARRQAVAGRQSDAERSTLESPARQWRARGDKAVERIEQLTRSRPELSGVRADAEAVAAELRETEGRVAMLDEAIASVPSPELSAGRARLVASAESGAEADRAELLDAVRSVDQTLESDRRRRATRDALLARMHGTVSGLEAAVSEVREWVGEAESVVSPNSAAESTRSASTTSPPDLDAVSRPAMADRSGASVELAERLQGLREGLVEVRRLPDHGSPPTQGLP
ncbi:MULTISPECIES: hypothetical protein [Actinoalloteichus]|uniref:Uncharacterized protein n=1 Tax=Actinoalloteichus fjordicus TaxID=1612552 RepID=A0AAC9PRC9_9PSEU|nr:MULTISPECIES: hypothetical protein [Actinoalloteichus]APU13973.1 hypothetical protein UA74_09550 [Actinoalloteichus fjordicus]APU19919.1 hypothetical protein UA75_09520 [Actinoalloteichus sp. GBA129-24]